MDEKAAQEIMKQDRNKRKDSDLPGQQGKTKIGEGRGGSGKNYYTE